MKTQKLNLLAFKQEELSRDNISLINAAGKPENEKPPRATSPTGAGGDDWSCYYDYETFSFVCEPIIPKGDPITVM